MAYIYMGKKKARQFFIDNLAGYFPATVPLLKCCGYRRGYGMEWLNFSAGDYSAYISLQSFPGSVQTISKIYKTVDYEETQILNEVDAWKLDPETRATIEHTYNTTEAYKRLNEGLQDLQERLERMTKGSKIE